MGKDNKQKDMKKHKNWNQGGKKRKSKFSPGEEQISQLLDQADEQELVKISAIHSDVSMPLPNREKLAWSVIDKADLADEEELERREKFQKMLRRRKRIRVAGICSAAAILLLVLAWCGVFDSFRMPAYENYYVSAGASFGGADPMEALADDALPEDAEVGMPSMAIMPYVDKDKLDTTIYQILSKYCKANGYALDEYKRLGQDFSYISTASEDGKIYLCCSVVGQCLDYKKADDGQKTWRDEGYPELDTKDYRDWQRQAVVEGGDDSDTPRMELRYPLNVDASTNVYTVYLRLHILI